MIKTQKLTTAIDQAHGAMKYLSSPVHTQKWQGMDIQGKPEMATYELLHYSLMVMDTPHDQETLAEQVKPNLPWAEDHFQERVGGLPLNPGVQWARWPYGKSADRFRTEGDQQFSHTYMERLWPRMAGMTHGGILPEDRESLGKLQAMSHFGIRYPYGDLDDVVTQLAMEPDT